MEKRVTRVVDAVTGSDGNVCFLSHRARLWPSLEEGHRSHGDLVQKPSDRGFVLA